jgi:hypothetical protein
MQQAPINAIKSDRQTWTKIQLYVLLIVFREIYSCLHNTERQKRRSTPRSVSTDSTEHTCLCKSQMLSPIFEVMSEKFKVLTGLQ